MGGRISNELFSFKANAVPGQIIEKTGSGFFQLISSPLSVFPQLQQHLVSYQRRRLHHFLFAQINWSR